MSASSSLVDVGFKVFALLSAGATIVAVSGLAGNVYFNTGRHRKPMPLPADAEGNAEVKFESPPAGDEHPNSERANS